MTHTIFFNGSNNTLPLESRSNVYFFFFSLYEKVGLVVWPLKKVKTFLGVSFEEKP